MLNALNLLLNSLLNSLLSAFTAFNSLNAPHSKHSTVCTVRTVYTEAHLNVRRSIVKSSPPAYPRNQWILAACLGLLLFDVYCHVNRVDRLALLESAIAYFRPSSVRNVSNDGQPPAPAQPCQRTATGWNCNVSPTTPTDL